MESVETNDECIEVQWDDQTSCKFPHLFLRDNCQCPLCFHASSQQRLLDVVNTVDVDIRASDVRHNTVDDVVLIRWPDNHESMLEGDWLRDRLFPKSWREAKPYTLYGIEQKPWSSYTMKKNLPFVEWEDLMSSDEALLTYLENLFVYGLSILRNAPRESGVLNQLPQRASLGYLKKTHYGEVFTVKSKPQPNNLAYTAEALPLHVDLPFLDYQPDFQCLHCIEQSEGEGSGTSTLTDGFYAAEKLRHTDPLYFDTLTKVNFKFNDIGTDEFGEFDMQCERPIIGLDSFGGLESISLNNHVRSSFINAPYEGIMDIYKAYYALTKHINSEVMEYKMSPGDIVCFNNKRVMHGRRSFDARTTTRWLEGMYMDADEVRSKYRTTRDNVLKNRAEGSNKMLLEGWIHFPMRLIKNRMHA